jgi:23S rRNA (adenine-N6)-dimethyltransferase
MRRHDHRLTHRRPELSQHFLRDAGVARALVRRLGFPPGAFVVEPGAGDGELTGALADAGYRVLAVEKDADLFRRLRQRFDERPSVECRFGDFLTMPLPRTPYRVVSNVPYGITAGLVRKLLAAPRPPDEAALVVQREAAEKFAGAPRETRFSLLYKPWFEIAIECDVPRRCFDPPPRVSSVLMRVQPRAAPLVAVSSAQAYRRFIIEAFGRGGPEASRGLRRFVTGRQLARLRRDLGFAADARPSELAFSQWLAIFRFVEHECLGHDPTRTRRTLEQHFLWRARRLAAEVVDEPPLETVDVDFLERRTPGVRERLLDAHGVLLVRRMGARLDVQDVIHVDRDRELTLAEPEEPAQLDLGPRDVERRVGEGVGEAQVV